MRIVEKSDVAAALGIAAAALCLCLFACSAAAGPLTSAADIQSAVDAGIADQEFNITATVLFSGQAKNSIALIDDSGGIRLSFAPELHGRSFCAGDLIRANGRTLRTFENRSRAVCTAVDLISHGRAPEIADISAKDLWEDRYLRRGVRIRGRVIHAFRDEIAPNWTYFILDCKGETAYAAVHTGNPEHLRPTGLIEAEISVKGLCETLKYSNRRQVARLVKSFGPDSIEVLSPGPADPFAAPALSAIAERRPDEIVKLGRHGCSGRVLAAWGKSDILMKALDGEIIRADLLQEPLPAPGDIIDIVGIPSISGMRISLSKAIWRASPSQLPAEKEPARLTLEELLSDGDDRACINVNRYGDRIEVAGKVGSLMTGRDEERLLLESGGFTIETIAGNKIRFPEELCCGCQVLIRGIFVVETDTWKSNYLLPQIKRAKIVMQHPDDLQITSFPPWWTTQRLFTAIAVLCALLLAILAWNILLRRLSERRASELAQESLARAETDMKVLERTRLAVELHDSVAQSLSAIGMEIETAGRYRQGANAELLQHLDTAGTTLKSCREELRNCLWDLRNQALEEPTMELAVRKTLLPHVKGIRLAVRFAFPREKLSDNTAHIILRIIRELVINAIRHGHADDIKIAGSSQAGILSFSVRDNGCGFDVQNCPGVQQGHFGLQGIRERIRPFNGDIKIESVTGSGTKATVTIPLPHAKLT
jgi:signal transduction histidine kinase